MSHPIRVIVSTLAIYLLSVGCFGALTWLLKLQPQDAPIFAIIMVIGMVALVGAPTIAATLFSSWMRGKKGTLSYALAGLVFCGLITVYAVTAPGMGFWTIVLTLAVAAATLSLVVSEFRTPT